MHAHTSPTSSAGEASLLHGFCFDCGRPAPHWRKLLGIGARFYTARDDDRRLIIKCARACSGCSGDALVVAPRVERAR